MRLIILYASEFGERICQLARVTGKYEDICFLDDRKTGPEIRACCADFFLFIDDETEFYPALEDADRRMNWMHRLMEFGAGVAVLAHPKAKIGKGTRLLAGSVVFAGAEIGENVLLKTGCICEEGVRIGVDSVFEECCRIGAGAEISGGTRVPRLYSVPSGRVVSSESFTQEQYVPEPLWEVRHQMLSGDEPEITRGARQRPAVPKQLAPEEDPLLAALRETGRSRDEILAFLRGK